MEIRDQRPRDALTAECVDLRSVTSSLDADPHVKAGETEDLRLNQLDWAAGHRSLDKWRYRHGLIVRNTNANKAIGP